MDQQRLLSVPVTITLTAGEWDQVSGFLARSQIGGHESDTHAALKATIANEVVDAVNKAADIDVKANGSDPKS